MLSWKDSAPIANDDEKAAIVSIGWVALNRLRNWHSSFWAIFSLYSFLNEDTSRFGSQEQFQCSSSVFQRTFPPNIFKKTSLKKRICQFKGSAFLCPNIQFNFQQVPSKPYHVEFSNHDQVIYVKIRYYLSVNEVGHKSEHPQI